MESEVVEVTKPKRRIRLRIVANDSCSNCFGSGLRVEQEFQKFNRKLEVSISVCACVKVER
jgi:hypothetical protein